MARTSSTTTDKVILLVSSDATQGTHSEKPEIQSELENMT